MASAAEAAGVLRCMRLNFSEPTRLAEQHGNVQLAVDVFERAKAMPATATSKEMAADGYHMVGPLFPHSDILFAHKGCAPKLVKPLQPKEAHRIRAFLAARGDVLNAHIISFELLWEDPAKDKIFMVMPRLPSCLDQIAPLSEAHACLFWEHMLSALEYLHALGFAHCDIKPSSICLQEVPLAFVLIDLGSIATFGERTASTPAYVPHDLPLHVRRDRSSAALDWCMLGMTIGEKCCGNAAITVGDGSQSMTHNNLMAHLSARLPGTLWEAYRLKSGMCEEQGQPGRT
jgi:serine/threonine protein kinase